MTTIFTFDAAALDGLWYTFKKGDGSSSTIEVGLYTDEDFGLWADSVIADENADNSTKLHANQYSDSMLASGFIDLTVEEAAEASALISLLRLN